METSPHFYCVKFPILKTLSKCSASEFFQNLCNILKDRIKEIFYEFKGKAKLEQVYERCVMINLMEIFN